MSSPTLPDFLPEKFSLERGRPRDYFELERFHYRPGRPATWADVWTIRYANRIVGVGVLSWPVPTCIPRDRAFNCTGQSYGQRIRFANANLRTISRVVIHPQFRSLGLASILIHCLCDNCTTRYVEAMAVMGRAHPMFDLAGMNRVEPADESKPIYYWMKAGQKNV